MGCFLKKADAHSDRYHEAMTERDFFRYYEKVTPKQLRACLAMYANLTRQIQRGAPTLVRMQRLMRDLNHPEKTLTVVHIAGTSGKGSVATLLAELIQAHGFTVGLTVSPHVRDLTERIQVNSVRVPEEDLCRLLRRCFEKLCGWSAHAQELPHYFELMTAAAFLWFSEQQVNYAIIETGLGGRFDATNILRAKNKICVFTPIDLDHQHLLGDTKAKIAMEKAGILAPEARAFSAPQVAEVCEVLNREASQYDSILTYTHRHTLPVQITETGTQFSDPTRGWSELTLALYGVHQAQNALLALDVMTTLGERDGWSLSETLVRQAIQVVSLPGRFTKYRYKQHSLIVDGAHNPQKMEGFLTTVRALYPTQSVQLLLGLASLEHAEALAEVLSRYQVQVSLADFEIGDVYTRYRLADVKELGQVFQKQGTVVQAVFPSLEQFLQNVLRSPENIGVITGSFYLAAEALPILDQIC